MRSAVAAEPPLPAVSVPTPATSKMALIEYSRTPVPVSATPMEVGGDSQVTPPPFALKTSQLPSAGAAVLTMTVVSPLAYQYQRGERKFSVAIVQFEMVRR